ncbi:MAG: DNA primase [Pseudanabaenaceae cyanobacterium]
MQLHPQTVEQVTQRLDIVDIVSAYVPLRKSGRSLRGACPFHKGNNPTAFSVDPTKQLYHCYSCGASGGAINFLMEINKQSFQEVVIELAKKYNIPIKTQAPEQAQELQKKLSRQEQLYEILAIAANFYQHSLWSPQGKEALDYLLTKRHLTADTIKEFQLGYAPVGWDVLHHYLVERKKFPANLVEAVGLIVGRNNASGFYDRFRNRLMIPICDSRGKVIGFGGRALDDSEPKYLNSPETELFNKGSILFALDKAIAAVSKADQVVVVEGYFDAIALHQAGIKNVVASMGTALTAEQMLSVLKYTESKRVIFNFDGDQAGLNATTRAIAGFEHLVFQGTVTLQILTLPDGKDADEFLRQNSPEKYLQLVAEAPLFLDWQIHQILKEKVLQRADHFQSAVKEITNLLVKIPHDSPLRTHYIYHSANLLAQGNSRLTQRLEQDLRRQLRVTHWYSRKPEIIKTPTSTLQTAEAQLLQVYLHFPEHRQLVYSAIETEEIVFSFSHHRFLWQLILDLLEQDKTTLDPIELYPNQLIQLLQIYCADHPETAQQLHSLLWLDETSRIPLLRPQIVVKVAIAHIKLVISEKRYQHWLKLWAETDFRANPELAHYYQQKIQAERAHIEYLKSQISISHTDSSPSLPNYTESITSGAVDEF